MKGNTQASGTVLVELAIALPFLLLVFAGGIEFVRLLARFQMVSELTRTASLSAFRSCEASLDSGMSDCLSNNTERIIRFLRNTPGSSSIQLRISVYRLSGSAVNKIGEISSPSAPASRYNESRVLTEITNLGPGNQTIVIGEGTTSFIPLLLLSAMSIYEQIII